jgi:uncharacterized protein
MLQALAAIAIFLGVALGMSYWANRARTDRSAYVGLYLVFGFPGVLLIVAGAAFAVSGSRDGITFLLIGLGLTLPMVKKFRVALARVTPMDPTSPIDMTGLATILPVMAFLWITFLTQPGPTDDIVRINLSDLLLQIIAFVGLAFILAGILVYRSLPEVIERLDLKRISLPAVGAALGAVVIAFLIQIVASVLTERFQPEVMDDLERVTKDMTANVRSPFGALALGLGAGVSEEILLRGAIQPRFGIVITSVLFALLHVQYGLTFTLAALFLTGVLFGLLKNRYGTWAAIIAHAVFNTLVVFAQMATD